MSGVASLPPHAAGPSEAHVRADAALTADVLVHLEAQVISVQGLLAIVLGQGKAIRVRDVQSVVRHAAMLQVEMHRRQTVESERSALLARAGVRLGVLPTGVTLELLTGLMDAGSATTARERSAQLRGLLDELQREHTVNRVLMNQELSFLDHLLRLVDVDASVAYTSLGDRQTALPTLLAGRNRFLDLEA